MMKYTFLSLGGYYIHVLANLFNNKCVLADLLMKYAQNSRLYEYPECDPETRVLLNIYRNSN